MKNLILIMICLILSACGSSAGINLGPYYAYGPTRESFRVCHGYSCNFTAEAGFNDKTWKRLTKALRTKSKTPELERKKIAQVIGAIEKEAGKQTGTHSDHAEAAKIRDGYYQLDCIDETINTALYLKFLQEEGLLKHHRYERSVHRGYWINGEWPHHAVVITHNKTGDQFVVDSYYKANGKPPYIMPFQDWIAGWTPHKP